MNTGTLEADFKSKFSSKHPFLDHLIDILTHHSSVSSTAVIIWDMNFHSKDCNNGKGEKPKCPSGREWIHNGRRYTAFFIGLCSSLPEGYDCTAVFDLTFDGKTRVCHHPSVDVPYKHAKLISESDLVHNSEETWSKCRKKQQQQQKTR